MSINPTHVLSTSLLRARLGQVAMLPPTEQQFVEYLCNAAYAIGCPTGDLVRALYVGIKLRQGVCLYGAPATQMMLLLETIAATIVGTGSDQIVRLHVPNSADPVMRRFGALRIGELIGSALDPAQQDKAWFLLLQGEGAATLLPWVEREIAAALGGTESRYHDHWPSNVVVLAAVSDVAVQSRCHWLMLRAPKWTPSSTSPLQAPVPPVGYQRQLLAARLAGPNYMHWLRERKQALQSQPHIAHSKLAMRWLAAAADVQGRGLWVPDDPQANADRALSALSMFVEPAVPNNLALDHMLSAIAR